MGGAERIKIIEERDGPIDAVWCVFDRDDFGTRDDQAHRAAEQAGFRAAGSDPCFELWFVLHYRDIHHPITTADCCGELEAQLGKPYSKTDSDLFNELEPHRPHAVQRAAELLKRHGKPASVFPNPSTTVHLLIADLLPE